MIERRFEMTALGLVLVMIGVVMVVAEAHAPSGALGVGGGLALIVGGVIAIMAVGGSAALAAPVGIVLGLVAGAWTLGVRRAVTSGPRRRIRAGAEALCGRIGAVRSWSGTEGTVFVEGSLWRARCGDLSDDGDEDSASSFTTGDRVTVEYVHGLTLAVRRAESWELG
jgi:membrane-bound serine protease (ClpP class)